MNQFYLAYKIDGQIRMDFFNSCQSCLDYIESLPEEAEFIKYGPCGWWETITSIKARENIQ